MQECVPHNRPRQLARGLCLSALLVIGARIARSGEARPPVADSATVFLLHTDALPLKDAGANHLEVHQSAKMELGKGRFGKTLVSRAGSAAWLKLPPPLQPAHTVTLECWVFVDNVTDESVQWVAARNAVYGFYVAGKAEAPILRWYVKTREGKYTALSIPVPRQQWFHAAGTFDGKALRCYINGKLAAKREFPGSLLISANPFVFGADEKGKHRFLGKVDEIRMSNIVRSEFMTGKAVTAVPAPVSLAATPAPPAKSAARPTLVVATESPAPEGNTAQGGVGNLLRNPQFAFHAFVNHRLGKAVSYESHNVAFWNTDAWGDITVVREANAPDEVRPPFATGALVKIDPGKRFLQFVTLPEVNLAHGDAVSLHVFASQSDPDALVARIRMLKLDSEDGTWRPADYGMSDTRTFPKHARGELVTAKLYETTAGGTGRVQLRIDGAVIPGQFHRTDPNRSFSNDVNTIAFQVEFANKSKEQPVWVWWPSLCVGPKARPRLTSLRPMTPWDRYIPRTIQKLWKGEPLHIIVMGSSIDRGSANPPMYLYDEDPNSTTFKQPLSDRTFEPDKVGRPDLEGYVGWWQHYWDYAGRLRLELMRKFDLPVNKLCLNFMACDGSCVGEAHSGLKAYCSLALAPEPGTNGQASGRTWQELYPDLFTRPGGPGPDLVIFGSGANEKTDTPDEVAVFEGTIRWIQRHYPNTEFIFCMFQNHGGYTPNSGDLQALSLRYGIPLLDAGKVLDDVTRWCNRYALVPRDGHPQAAGHYLWFKTLEQAFECWDPIVPGAPQQVLPERIHPNTYGWEGEMVTFERKSPRIHGNMFVFEDTAINCWGGVSEGSPVPYVDGLKMSSRRSSPRRDLRNSLFRHGHTTLGDRHILEITGKDAFLSAVDAKVCPNRRFFPVDAPCWRPRGKKIEPFESQWGAPFGNRTARLQPGESLDVDVVATDLSVAYVDAAGNGTLRVEVDGVEKLTVAADQPFKDTAGHTFFLENRKGIRGLPWGLHTVRIEAVDALVSVLGLFTYDSRPNRKAEREQVGRAAPGETVTFTAPYRARPVVFCDGGLAVQPKDIQPDRVTFSGTGPGWFRAVGE